MEIMEFTVSTQPRPAHRTESTINLWIRNSDALQSYQPTHHSRTRDGITTQTLWNRDWLTLDLDFATIEMEQAERDLTEVQISPKKAVSSEELDLLVSAVLRALSLLWMRRVNPIMVGFTFADSQSLTLHRPRLNRKGARFVYSDASSETEWLTKAIHFFGSGTQIAKRTWQAVESVLDATNQYRAIQTAVATEQLARAYWTETMGQGANNFKVSTKVKRVLQEMGQTFVDDELGAWRWYRDGSLHGNEDFLNSEPLRKMQCWEYLDRLLVRLIVGIVGYSGSHSI